MKTSDFNYELPPELIAQTPIPQRDASRLLVLDKNTGAWQHRHFYDLPEYLRPGDCHTKCRMPDLSTVICIYSYVQPRP